MKIIATTVLAILLAILSPAFGADEMKGMDMNGMHDHNAMGKKPENEKAATTHHAFGVVKKVDTVAGRVTLAHEPIKSLEWPAMTMAFGVKDKSLFDKLVVGKKVEVELVKQGDDYLVTAVK